MLGLAGATVVLSVLSTVWVVRTGHEAVTPTDQLTDAIDGAVVYAANCARRHGDTAEGGRGYSSWPMS